ncbi:NAD-dependent malic enzyme [Oleiagrimonas sp. C23AA]|uniref:NAD-dependent malic enzyme n=1 Tax=Oleiagrimonas sp. C23AA TaxID=2719047 RepID=UPI00142069DA|nr:NAD-dependent malic enzyme [Oleiagrimonas sp. C23AA]NII09088.1 NAD-dependent malic enzyme [Oleiagrimonas sp. C23AA]
MTSPRDSSDHLVVHKQGTELLTDPLLNKGTAFTESERDTFALHGLLPPHIGDMEEQIERRLAAIRELKRDLDKYLQLRNLQDSNETLFYALLERHLTEMLPLVYTPTVGKGCQTFSRYFHYPRGLFIGYPQRDRIDAMLAHPRFDNVRVIVVSDGERILGLGDQGAGGMGIPIGKLSLYTACAGIDPATTLPVLLDPGTDNQERLDDPLYIGWRHRRKRGEDYDDFVEAFVQAVKKRWPHVLLQWEDFARSNAQRLLDRYREQLCTFNDDIQGTAAVAAGTLLAAARATGSDLKSQTIVIYGAGSAGCGIGRLLVHMMMEEGLSEDQAWDRFYAIDSQGLLLDDQDLPDFKQPFARRRDDIKGWKVKDKDRVALIDVVKHAKPSVLLGLSGQGGAFNEEVIRAMAKHAEQPIVLPLSNPVANSEAAPQDVLDWTDGKALVGTGSPFDPVKVDGQEYTVDQVNNAYVFPGVGLGLMAVKATYVSDGMFAAAAQALAHAADVDPDGPATLLPPIDKLRDTARTVAIAVAKRARKEKHCERFDDHDLEAMIDACMWRAEYKPYALAAD